jgi:hypothetical protein
MSKRSLGRPRRCRWLTGWVVLVAAAALVGAGCGGAEEPPPPQPAETAPTDEPEAEGALGDVRAALEEEGYEVSDGPPAEGGEAERLGAREGLLVSRGDLVAEVFEFPTPDAAKEYTDALVGGEPAVAADRLTFAGASDDSQRDIEELARAAGVEP